jgi:uncharacterized spore protein YtfJ
MKAEELMGQVNDALQARRIFGDPYQKNGLTIIPVATVRGGWGGGAGQSASPQEGQGWGGGGGVTARPVGAFVVKGDEVTWQPTVDVNRIVLVGQLVAIAAIVTVGMTIRALSRKD